MVLAVGVCFVPFGLAALVIEAYLQLRDRYMARKRDEAVRNGNVVEFKRRAA